MFAVLYIRSTPEAKSRNSSPTPREYVAAMSTLTDVRSFCRHHRGRLLGIMVSQVER